MIPIPGFEKIDHVINLAVLVDLAVKYNVHHAPKYLMHLIWEVWRG